MAWRRLRRLDARTLDARTGAARFTREVAVVWATVLLLGVGAAHALPGGGIAPTAADRVRPASAQAGHAPTEGRPAPPEPAPDPASLPPAAVPAQAPPLPPAPPVEQAAAAPAPLPEPAAARWLPTGTGMWLHEWQQSEGGSAAAVVARAQATGLSHLYVQTGSSRKGWIGEEVLGQLLPATTGTGIRVIAWDFPKLNDPEADARRLVAAATWANSGVPRVAAVAPDVETAAEGTQLSADAVRRYYSVLRAELPPEIAILATVPWPSEKRTSSYPYAETAEFSDAFVPMAYWYNRSPHVVTATSMEYLAQFGLPVMPVGQGYDGRLDAPYLAPDPDPAASVQAFVDAAKAGGAQSISLWSWQTTGAPQWDVLARAGSLFPQ